MFLVRHGEVDAAWRDHIYGCLDVALSERGREEAVAAAERLRGESLAAVVSSGLARSDYGADRLNDERGVERIRRSELRELDRGDWAGRPVAHIEAKEPGALARWARRPSSIRAPGGESLADVDARVFGFLDELARAYAGESIAVVAHLWVIRVTVCRALDLHLDHAPRLELETGGMVVVDWPVDDAPAAVRGERRGGVAAVGENRPTLAAFGGDEPPPLRGGWYRGPSRRS